MLVEFIGNKPGRPMIKVEHKTNPGLLFYERDLKYQKIILSSIASKLFSEEHKPVSPEMIWLRQQMQMIERYLKELSHLTEDE